MRVTDRAAPRRRRDEFRPTLARVRDAMFNSLGARTSGARVLDLFAGSGALGMEALRRGAAHAVFVEQNAKLATGLRHHLADEQLMDRAEVWKRDALAAVRDLGLAAGCLTSFSWIPPMDGGSSPPPCGALVPRGFWRRAAWWRPRGTGVTGRRRPACWPAAGRPGTARRWCGISSRREAKRYDRGGLSRQLRPGA